MHRFQLVLALLSVVGCAFSACGTEDTAGQTASSTGSGAALDCSNDFLTLGLGDDASSPRSVACNACLHQNCCAELAACAKAGPNCMRCAALGIYSPQCDSIRELYKPLYDCSGNWYVCQHECWPRDLCNGPGANFDGGVCIPDEPDGAVSMEECSTSGHAIVRGTLDGKPYNKTFPVATVRSYTPLDQPEAGIVFGTSLDDFGYLQTYWRGVCAYGDSIPVPVLGTLKLPGEDTARDVKSCSLMWYSDRPVFDRYRFNLTVEGGQLTGCAYYAW